MSVQRVSYKSVISCTRMGPLGNTKRKMAKVSFRRDTFLMLRLGANSSLQTEVGAELKWRLLERRSALSHQLS